MATSPGGWLVPFDPYFLNDAVLIVDEAHNLFTPARNDRITRARYAQLRGLLMNPAERMKKVSPRPLESQPSLGPLPHPVGRCHGLNVFVLSATPGRNKGQLETLLNS